MDGRKNKLNAVWRFTQGRRGKMRLAVSVLTLAGVLVPDGAIGSAGYGYDPDGRLATALYDNGICIAYAYDSNGNRTSQTISTAQTSPTWGTGVWGCFTWTP